MEKKKNPENPEKAMKGELKKINAMLNKLEKNYEKLEKNRNMEK